MKFEQFPQPEQERAKDSKVESRFDRYMRKAKYLAKIGWCVGTLALGGLAVKQSIENSRDYRNYYEEKTPEADKERYRELRGGLALRVGEKAVKKMEIGDRTAFWERRDVKEAERKPPAINGFKKVGLDRDILEELWSEQNGSYPKGWINGEVSEVIYMGKVGEKNNGGWATAVTQDFSKIITMYKAPYDYTGQPSAFRLEKFDTDFGHELGHMNDWETDINLSLLERAELLSKIVDRMRSESPYKSPLESKPYYQNFHSRNIEEQDHIQVKEYWGALCGGYFSIPEWVKEKYPEDYAIVDEYVKKADPAFDPVRAEEERDSLIKNSIGESKTDK